MVARLKIDPDSVKAAQAALDAHHKHMALEDDNGPETDMWHLLLSLREYCDRHALRFDDILQDVKQEEAIVRGEEEEGTR